MLILERSVTREHWEPSYRYLTRRVQTQWARPAASIRGTRVWMIQGMGLGTRNYYAIFEHTANGLRPVAWLMIKQRPGWWTWEVEQLWVFPERRGFGLASKLYCAAINHDRIMIASGKTHTRHSRAMWEKFVRCNVFSIWAQDFDDLSRTGDVFWDKEDDEMGCSLPLYSPAKTGGKLNHNNVRLVAMSKRCS